MRLCYDEGRSQTFQGSLTLFATLGIYPLTLGAPNTQGLFFNERMSFIPFIDCDEKLTVYFSYLYNFFGLLSSVKKLSG